MEYHYFQSVPGHLVSRFGDRFGSYIGAEVVKTAPLTPEGAKPKTFSTVGTEIKWTTETVAIPATEFVRYRREYTRCIREGSLVRVVAPTT